MSLSFVRFASFIFAYCVTLNAVAELHVPPLTGSLSGDLRFANAPTLSWKITADTITPGQYLSRIEAASEGLHLRGHLKLDPTTSAVSWQIDEGRLSLGVWTRFAVARFFPALDGITAAGELKLSGTGTWANNRPTGNLSLEGNDIAIQHIKQSWTLQGVRLTGQVQLAADGTIRSTLPLELSVSTITSPRFGARNLRLRGMLQSATRFEISAARLEIAGGEIEAEPFVMPLDPLSVDTRVHASRVGLRDFVALVPSGLSDAQGKLSGDVRITWTAHEKVRLGAGDLALDEIEPTIIRLASLPGLLTARVPGAFKKSGISVSNPTIPDLRAIELGKEEIEVKSLRIHLTPEGDARGRSAHVEIDGRPRKANSSVRRVTFSINVVGPIADVMNLGLRYPFSFDLR